MTAHETSNHIERSYSALYDFSIFVLCRAAGPEKQKISAKSKQNIALRDAKKHHFFVFSACLNFVVYKKRMLVLAATLLQNSIFRVKNRC